MCIRDRCALVETSGHAGRGLALAHADLRHEAIVGAERIWEVAIARCDIEHTAAVTPRQRCGVTGERAAVPLGCELRPVRGAREAVQILPGDAADERSSVDLGGRRIIK